MMDFTLMDWVLTTIGMLVTLSLVCCICCIIMKFNDLRLKLYIKRTAKKKGVKVDLDNLDSRKCQSPHVNENCTIMVPDVGYIL